MLCGILFKNYDVSALADEKNTKRKKRMFINLFISETASIIQKTLSIFMIVVMAIAALAAIVLILLQQGNSTGINALGGSSETFFGKNKGKSLEAKMKKWTIICLAILLVFSVLFFVIPKNTAIWS